MQREDALDRLAVAGPQPDRQPERAEGDPDQRGEREQHQDPGGAGLEVGAEGERDRPGRRSPGSAPGAVTPASWPASSAEPRSGVSCRRLKNPCWMSPAIDWPAPMVANSAPCMKVSPSAKLR